MVKKGNFKDEYRIRKVKICQIIEEIHEVET